MPLQELNSIKSGKIALWHITENEIDLSNKLELETCPENIISPLKRLEWICGRLLLQYLATSLGESYEGVQKDEFGKPFLKQSKYHISLSHSYPFVAAQIHPEHSVGIDIEQPKEKLLRIAPRILDEGELKNAGTDVIKHCVYWCAKEALYKVYGKRGLLFTHHLHLKPFDLQKEGDLKGWIEVPESQILVELYYLVTKDYVLVHTKTN